MDYKTAKQQVIDEMVASQGGVFGAVMTPVGDLQGDLYAPGDARTPFAFNPTKRKKKQKTNKNKKKKKDENDDTTDNVMLFRRPVIKEQVKRKRKISKRRKLNKKDGTGPNQCAIKENIEMDDLGLGCVLACNGKKYKQLAIAIIESHDVPIVTYDNCIIIEGVDEQLGKILENIMDLLGEDVFESNYMAYISEMCDVVANDKNKDKYSKGQLRMGSNVEGEHTKNERLAGLMAKHHLDSDPEYYDKKRRRENTNGKQQQEQRKKLRKSNRKTSVRGL